MDFKNQKFWIIGASSGIGEALTYELYNMGATLIISARRKEELKRIQQQLDPKLTRIHILQLDLSNQTDTYEKAHEVLNRFGYIDKFINCAGISQRSFATDTIIQVERALMEVNFFGPVVATKVILPSMVQRNSGHIILISSLVGKFGAPLRSGYAASKHALHGYFDSLRAEVYDKGINITIVCPGFIKTGITMNSLTANGEKYGKVDNAIIHGMPVDKCAKLIIKGICKKREEFLIGGKETYGVYIKRFFPNLFSRLISKLNTI